MNPIVGDLDGNAAAIVERLDEAQSRGCDLVLFPELAVTGYPPEDLLLRPGFVRAAERTLRTVAARAAGVVAVIGFPHFDADLYNAAAVCARGAVQAIYRKRFLPNYGVFDECLLVVDIDPKAVIGRRLRDVRRRALARDRESAPQVEPLRVGEVRPR